MPCPGWLTVLPMQCESLMCHHKLHRSGNRFFSLGNKAVVCSLDTNDMLLDLVVRFAITTGFGYEPGCNNMLLYIFI